MKRKMTQFDVKSELVVAWHELLRDFYPGLTREDWDRSLEILAAIPKEDYRREDPLLAVDQAYCEARGIECRLTRKTFVQ